MYNSLKAHDVVKGTSLPKYIYPANDRGIKLAETMCKTGIFAYRRAALIKYYYWGLYYTLDKGQYIYTEKSRLVRYRHDSMEQMRRRIRFVGRFKSEEFKPNLVSIGSDPQTESYKMLKEVYDEHVAMMKIKREKKDARELLKLKRKEKRENKRKMRFLKNDSCHETKWGFDLS